MFSGGELHQTSKKEKAILLVSTRKQKRRNSQLILQDTPLKKGKQINSAHENMCKNP